MSLFCGGLERKVDRVLDTLSTLCAILRGILQDTRLRASIVGFYLKEKVPMLEVTLTTEQKVKVKLEPKTLAGNPAPVDGIPTWSITSGEGDIAVAENGLEAFLIAPETAGDTVYTVEADADLGSGIETISDVILVHTQHARAASLGLSVGTPELK